MKRTRSAARLPIIASATLVPMNSAVKPCRKIKAKRAINNSRPHEGRKGASRVNRNIPKQTAASSDSAA